MLINSNGSLSRVFLCTKVVILLTLGLLSPPTASSYELIIGAGTEGSFSYYVGKVFCRKLEKHQPDYSCRLTTSDDAVDDLTNIQGGSLDLAIVDSLLLHQARQNTGSFSFLDITYDRIRLMAPLYAIPLSIIVQDNGVIEASSQLQGKPLNVGPPGSSTKQLFEMVMQAHGWTERDFPVFGELPSSQSQDTIAFRQQRFQAMLHRDVHPDPVINQLLTESQGRLLGFSGEQVSNLLSQNPALSVVMIPGSTYKELDRDIYTFGTTMSLVASADMDADTARAIGATLIGEESVLKGLHPSLSSFQMSGRAEFFDGIKVHPAVLDTVRGR